MRVPFLSFLFAACLCSGAVQAAIPAALGDGTKLPTLAPMLEQVSPAVVNIATYTNVRQYVNPLLNDPFFRRFFNIPESAVPKGRTQRRTQSAGSGVIVDAKNGYVLTNAHVVARASEIEVGLVDGRTLKAELVGMDTHVDIAVLKIPAQRLVQIRTGRSADLRVGDFVVAIGNPFGLGQTVTSGIVSALGRSGLGIEGLEDFIQTDASINPGNSGGALVNLRGELIGINTAIFAPAGGNIGIGFAIPVDLAREMQEQLLRHGEVRRGSLGVTTQDLTEELAAAFALDDVRGVLLTAVEPGGAAARAGLQAGDVVVAVDTRAVKSTAEFRNRIGLALAGNTLQFDILREGKPKRVAVTLAELPRRGEGNR
jgi:serine protease DegQ